MPTSADKIATIDQILAQKRAEIDARTVGKVAQLDPFSASVQAYWARAEEEQREQIAEAPRSLAAKFNDSSHALGRTTVGMGADIASLALSAQDKTAGALVRKISGNDQASLAPAQDWMSSKVRNFDGLMNSEMSDTSRINEEIVAADNAADAARHQAEFETGRDFGGVPEPLGIMTREVMNAGSAIKNTARNPTALFNSVVGQAPTLGIGVGAKLAVTEAQILSKAASLGLRAEARAMTTAQIRKKAAEEAATTNLQLGIGVSEGAGAGRQALEQVTNPNIPLAEIVKAYPKVAELMAQGLSEQQARYEVGQTAQITAAAVAGPLTAATGKIAARFELDPTGVGGAGSKTILGAAKHAGADIGRETTEEFFQSGTGALAVNVGARVAGNENQDLLEGVGEQAGTGAVTGMGMAAGFKAPGLVAKGTGQLIDATTDAIKQTIQGRLANQEAARVATVSTDVRARDEAMRKTLQESEARIAEYDRRQAEQAAAANPNGPAPVLPTRPSDVPLSEETILSPAGKETLGAADPEMSLMAGMNQAMAVLNNPQLDPEAADDLHFFVMKQGRGLGKIAQGAAEQLQTMPADHPDRPLTQQVFDSVMNVLKSDQFQSTVNYLQGQDNDSVQAKLDAMPEKYDPATATPEQARAAERVKALLYSAPEKITVAAAKKIGPLFQSTGDEGDARQYELVLQMAQLKEDTAAQQEAIKAEHPNFKVKTSDAVGKEISEKGFTFENRRGEKVTLRSVADFVNLVSSASARGEVQVAAKRIGELANFVAHMTNKAAAFDAGAMQLINEGRQNNKGEQGKLEVNFATLNAQGAPTRSEPAFVRLGDTGGQILVDNIFNDANAAATSLNALIKAFPQAAKIAKVSEAKLPGKPKWKSYSAPEVQEQTESDDSRSQPGRSAPGGTTVDAEAVDDDEVDRSAEMDAAMDDIRDEEDDGRNDRTADRPTTAKEKRARYEREKAERRAARKPKLTASEEEDAFWDAAVDRGGVDPENVPQHVQDRQQAETKAYIQELSNKAEDDLWLEGLDRGGIDYDQVPKKVRDRWEAENNAATKEDAANRDEDATVDSEMKQAFDKAAEDIKFLDSKPANEAIETLASGGITLSDGSVAKFTKKGLTDALALINRVIKDWATYPVNGKHSEQVDWLYNQKGVTMPREIAEYLTQLYQAGEAIAKFGKPDPMSAAEASGSTFEEGTIKDWTKGRSVIDDVTDMTNLCLGTSDSTVWLLQAHGYKAARAYGAVQVPGGKPGETMDHFTAIVEIDGQRFAVDQPQGELFTSTGTGDKVKIKTKEFKPRFIPESEQAKAYETPGVKFSEAANVELEGLPFDGVTVEANAASNRTVEEQMAELGLTPEQMVEFGLGQGLDFAKDPTDEAGLAKALAMTEKEYLETVNPGNKRTEVKQADGLIADELDVDAPTSAPIRDLGNGIELRPNGNYLYAVDTTQEDLVVGMIATGPDGNTFAVAPEMELADGTIKKYQGMGIGRALMRELLLRKPLALSGGLSDLAEKTRLSALRELRAEKQAEADAKNPAKQKSLLDRFKGLVEKVSDTLEGKNQFLNAFKLAKNSQGIFNRMLHPHDEISEILSRIRATGNAALAGELFPEHLKFMRLKPGQLSALESLFGEVAPAIADRLNGNLAAAAHGRNTNIRGQLTKGEGFFGRFMKDPAKEWSYQNRKTLHVAQMTADGKSMEYQPEVLEAMALAGMSWLMSNINNPVKWDVELIGRLFPKGDYPQRVGELFEEAHYYELPVRQLASLIGRTMGVTANNDAPINQTSSGMLTQLALDTMRAMADVGFLQIEEAQLDNKKLMYFIKFDKIGEVGSLLQGVSDKLGSTTLLPNILTPDARTMPSIGKPFSGTDTKVRGQNTPLSTQQTKNLEVMNNLGFKMNEHMLNLMGKLGPGYSKLLGYVDDVEVLNMRDKARVLSKNKAIMAGIQHISDMYDQITNYADQENMSEFDVPVYDNWGVISNGRMMMSASVNQQSNKTVRELLTVNHSVIDIENQQHMLELRLAAAQALGVKTDNQTHAQIVEALDKKMADPRFQALFDALTALRTTEDADPAEALRLLGELEINTDRGVHAAETLSRLLMHTDPGEPFKHALAFEIDGKTDGPMNAMVHYGLSQFSKEMMIQLRQGGLFINQPDGKRTLNEQGRIGDLYQSAADGLERAFKVAYTAAGSEADWYREDLMTQLDVIHYIKHADINDEGDSVIKRSIAKHGVMASTYGSSMYAIVRVFAKEISTQFYKDLSTALSEGKALDPRTVRMISYLTGANWDSKGPKDYKNFAFTAEDMNNIANTLMGSEDVPGVGRMLVEGIHADMAPMLDTFKLLYKASGFQVFNLRRHYNKLYAAKHAALVEAGEILKTDGLSRNQEQEILDSLVAQMPIYKSMVAKGVGQGINVFQKDHSGELHLPGRENPERVGPIGGGMTMDIAATSFLKPGVRIAAMSTIAIGDATMMSQMFRVLGDMLNVFDGLEVSVGEIGQRARQVNGAVWDGWTKFNPLTVMADSFEQLNWGTDPLTDDEVKQLLIELRVDIRKISPYKWKATLQEMFKDTRQQLRATAIRTEAYKRALAEQNIAVDHMAGGMRPFQMNSDTTFEGTEDELVAHIQARAAVIEQELKALYYTNLREKAALPEAETSSEETKAAIANADSDQVVDEFVEPEPAPEVVLEGVPALPTSQPAPVHPVSGKMIKRSKELAIALGLESDGDGAVTDMAILDNYRLAQILQKLTYDTPVLKFVAKSLLHLIPKNIRVYVGTPERISAAKAKEFEGVNLGGPNEVGAYYSDTIFLTVASTETLIHELVHATTLHLIHRFYSGDLKGFTAVQREAMRALEALTKSFVKLNLKALDGYSQDPIDRAQAVVRGFLQEGDMPSAVNEFMAWALTNESIARSLGKTAALDSLKKLATSILNTVRRLLGLPNNVSMDNFLGQTLGQFHRLVRRRTDIPRLPNFRATFQSLAGGTNQPHEAHLIDTLDRVERILFGIPGNELTVAQHDNRLQAIADSAAIRDGFLDAGFKFSEKEAAIFGLVQAIFASSLQLDPVAMTAMQEIHRQVINNLTYVDFLDDPSNNTPTQDQIGEAQRKLNALTQVYAEDKFKRSNLLANFIGLALTNEGLRKKLGEMTMPKESLKRETIDETLRNAVKVGFDKLSNTIIDIKPGQPHTRTLDTLLLQLVKVQAQTVDRLTQKQSPMEIAEQQVRTWQDSADGKLRDYIETRRVQKEDAGKIDGYINLTLSAVRGLLTDEGAGSFQKGVETFINTIKAPKAVRDLVSEVIGLSDSSAALGQLLNKSKHAIARVRQRLRDEAPAEVRSLFAKTYDKATWQALGRSVARADLQALMTTSNITQLTQLINSPAALSQEIAATILKLDPKHKSDWVQHSEDLADWMVNRVNNATFLLRNSRAIAEKGSPRVNATVALRNDPIIDRLVSLYALQKMAPSDLTALASVINEDPKGMHGMLRLMRSMVDNERGKPGTEEQSYNAWKGHIPVSTDPRTDLILAGPEKGKELLKRGYRRVGEYDGDSDDYTTGLAYYATSLTPGKFEIIAGGKPTFNQGAMQTVQETLGGVDRLTGQSLDNNISGAITTEESVAHAGLRRSKRNGRKGQRNMIPVFNADGSEIIAYERVLDNAMVEAHLNVDHDLSKSIGMWMGRQAEEQFAAQANQDLLGLLKTNWDEGVRDNREGEYLDISASGIKSIDDAWNSIPREVQRQMKQLWGGRVMVRKDMVNNAIGYRSSSIADVFTDMGDLPKPIREGIEKAALAMFGLNAYRYLYTAEKTWQGLVGGAKDWIVVRSGVVAFANGLANQFQLVMMGVPVHRLIQVQARKVKETEQYLRNERRLAQLGTEIRSATTYAAKAKLELEGRLLRDESMRLSIWPLIEAGELPSISEGLTEQDEYSLLNDVSGWVSAKFDKLPKGMTTAAKYAIISKDTALYQGLNRMIQFGDFMAKAALYEHLMEGPEKMSSEDALEQVTESFVNYNLMAGRSREYLESMGLTWFLNYKLRIQKIALRTLRKNPLRFVLGASGAAATGSDSLVSTFGPGARWGYGLGVGPFFRAHNMLLWDKLF